MSNNSTVHTTDRLWRLLTDLTCGRINVFYQYLLTLGWNGAFVGRVVFQTHIAPRGHCAIIRNITRPLTIEANYEITTFVFLNFDIAIQDSVQLI